MTSTPFSTPLSALEIAKRDGEIERLRAALEEIAEGTQGYLEIREIARRALKDKP